MGYGNTTENTAVVDYYKDTFKLQISRFNPLVFKPAITVLHSKQAKCGISHQTYKIILKIK